VETKGRGIGAQGARAEVSAVRQRGHPLSRRDGAAGDGFQQVALQKGYLATGWVPWHAIRLSRRCKVALRARSCVPHILHTYLTSKPLLPIQVYQWPKHHPQRPVVPLLCLPAEVACWWPRPRKKNHRSLLPCVLLSRCYHGYCADIQIRSRFTPTFGARYLDRGGLPGSMTLARLLSRTYGASKDYLSAVAM
jgi:hypothetical protein